MIRPGEIYAHGGELLWHPADAPASRQQPDLSELARRQWFLKWFALSVPLRMATRHPDVARRRSSCRWHEAR